MSARLTQIVSWWFILQIVLPFTAPLQTLELHDLFGTHRHHRSDTSSHESTTTPTMSESGTAASIAAINSPVFTRPLPSGWAISAAAHAPVRANITLASSPQVQQSVLRL